MATYDTFGPNEMAVTKKEKLAFSQRLKQALADKGYDGLSQKEIGAKFGGVSGPTVSYWLSADKMPSVAHGIVIAKALGVAFEWLMTGRGDKLIGRRPTPEAEAMLLVFEGLNHNDQAQMLMNAAAQAWAKGDEDQAKMLREMAENIKNLK